MNELKGIKIGYALTGSYCTFAKAFEQAEKLVEMGAELIPIMSENAAAELFMGRICAIIRNEYP